MEFRCQRYAVMDVTFREQTKDTDHKKINRKHFAYEQASYFSQLPSLLSRALFVASLHIAIVDAART